jgi:hypothetical protein
MGEGTELSYTFEVRCIWLGWNLMRWAGLVL